MTTKSELFNPDQPGTFCWVGGTVTYPRVFGKQQKKAPQKIAVNGDKTAIINVEGQRYDN